MTEIGFDGEKIDGFFKGKYSEKDTPYVDEVFFDNDKEEELRCLLSGQFDELMADDDSDKKNLDHILYRIHYDIHTRLSERNILSFDNIIKWTLRIAGVLILSLIVFFEVQTHKETYLKKETWVEIKSPAWTRAQFSLPDGTTGWLNSNSSVKYNGNFVADRQVILKGEAFFDVFKDKRRPFKVNTDEVNVTALGTRFNIASYENEKNVEVVLEEGKLLFNNREMNKSFTMNPNDLLIYDKPGKDFSTEVVQPHKYLSWTEGKLVFRNDPLDVIARRLERWYNIDVEVDLISPEDLRLRATFIDENLEQVLNLLKRSLHVSYKIVNGYMQTDGVFRKTKVIISPRPK
jgi:ferric-dicitrate binding protein FerR (iron transport regulator)